MKQDKKKLKRLLHLINHGIENVRVMGAESLIYLLTWVDKSYAVHQFMNRHNVGVIYLGRVLIHRGTQSTLYTASS